MIKRKAAASFLILAGMLFLGHAVVPHHHHGNLVCYVKSHCDGEYPAGKSDSGPDNHHHDNEDCENHCVLKNPVVVSSNQAGSGLKITDLSGSQTWSDNHIAGLQANQTGLPDTDLLHSISVPPVIFLYPSLSSHSPGLRAPPTV
jgi:hypothetical protein